MRITDRDRRALAVFAVFVCVVAIYGPRLHSEFVYDDYAVAGDNLFIRDPANLSHLFTGDYYREADENTYRPVTTLTYFFDYRIWGAEPFGFNFTGMLLHFFASLLVMRLARRIVGGPWWASLVAGLVFAAHPICTEAVVSEGNREEGLSVLFYVGAFLLYLRSREKNDLSDRFASGLVFAVGLFAMEMTVTLPTVLLAAEWVLRKDGEPFDARAVARRLAPFVAIAALFLVGRFTLWVGTGDFSEFPGGSRWGTLLTMTRVFLTYVRLLLVPVGQHVIYDVDVSTTLADPRVIASALAVLALLGAGLLLAWRRSVLGLSVLWFFVVLLPVSNVVIPFWILLSERYLYLALPSLALAVAWIAARASARLSGAAKAAAVVCCFAIPAILAVAAYARADVWTTSRALWSDNVAKAPGALDARYNLAIDHLRRGETDDARRHLEAAAADHPEAASVWIQLATLHRTAERYAEADECLDRALAAEPDDAGAMVLRAHLYVDQKRFAEAVRWLDRALEVEPDDAATWSAKAGAKLALGERMEALKSANSALARDPHEPTALQVMAHLFASVGDDEEAVRVYWDVARYATDPAMAEAALANIRVLGGKGRP